MSYAFAALGIDELRAMVAHDNLSAQRLCMDSGFTLSHDNGAQYVLSAYREEWERSGISSCRISSSSLPKSKRKRGVCSRDVDEATPRNDSDHRQSVP